jgi:type IV secretory pathway VirB2 component (pilin)
MKSITLTRQTMFSLAVCLLMVSAMGSLGFADTTNAGRGLLDSLTQLITGQLGLFIGLFIVILGLWTWIIKQETGAGITMIIGGVLITLAPGIFNGARSFAENAINTFSGGANNKVQVGVGGG